ncbi:MAG: Unknown protein [uncultured Aureispira sp.]|uniref:Uncharacterized protein n=1 Tax=uncultured Aureispira sp. TaxID=1331704 RepID=A0A6S6TF87_9BACT|nr:MAG: Unknown protein [uncultured Aureispira sp.]
MKIYLIVFLFVLLNSMVYSQQMDSVVISPEMLSKAKEFELAKYDISRESKYIIYLPMNYSKFLFTEKDKDLFYTLRDTMIERIDLVYTVFRRSESFDQVQLNKERYEIFQQFFPQAFNNNLIDWNLMAQNGTMDYDEAQTYFHGFVIYLKPHRVTTKNGITISTAMDTRVDEPETKILETNEEVAQIKTLLGKSTATKIIQDTTYTTIRKRFWTGLYLSKNRAGRKKGKRFKTVGRKRPKEYRFKEIREMKITEREVPDLEAAVEPDKIIAEMTNDSVVYSVLNRTLGRWEDHVVVQDVTGSMHPYLTQTLLFLRGHIKANTTEKFVFFNDGDHKPDGPLGYSGGCYYTSADNVEEIQEMAFEAMRKGKGGKAPENDVEAILYGIKKFPNCKGIVLVADNFSRIRDFRLIPRLMKLGKPVRIIICGIAKGDVVNLDYIYLARYTKGSIHTLNEDITDLSEKEEGSAFKVGSQYFKIEKNAIKLIHQSKSKNYDRY